MDTCMSQNYERGFQGHFWRWRRAQLWRDFASSNPRYSAQLQDEAEQQRYRADWSSTNVTGLECKYIPKENWGLDYVHGGDVAG